MKEHEQVDYEWRLYAECVGIPHDLFFPKRGQSTKKAKAVCEKCVVKTDCLEDAIVRREPAGIRGGLSTRERQTIIKERKKQ